MPIEIAVLGGGCFWCTEAIFKRIKGVLKVEPGYAGGWKQNPTYEEVCTGETGHAEVVRITFDDAEISYRELLEIFFSIHDPTSLNRQGNDVGTQYRSIILYKDEIQRNEALEIIEKLSKFFEKPIVTEVSPLKEFYPAEEYHQEFYERNKSNPYCLFVINPKILKLKEKWKQYLKES